MGGCLFLDEAYALADNGGDGFSGEAVRTLLTEVENNRTALMVVLAGYADKMANLMRADPGAMHCSFCLCVATAAARSDVWRYCGRLAIRAATPLSERDPARGLHGA
jgi:hypothetical protein